MHDLPVPEPTPKSPTTKLMLVVGVIICLAAATGIGVLGLDLFRDATPVVSGQGASGDDSSDTSVVSTKPASPHKVLSAPCDPLSSVSTSPKLSRMDGGAPRDSTFFSSARCDSASEKTEVRANVDYRIYYDTSTLKGAEPARDHYDSAVKVYAKKDEFERVSDVGDAAFAIPLTDDIWQLELVDANMTLTVTADGGPDREADLALAKRVAQAYIDATS